MEQFKCSHCGSRKNETEILIATSYKGGKKQLKRICTSCISRSMPNPLRKVNRNLWIIIWCLSGIIGYLLAYKIF